MLYLIGLGLNKDGISWQGLSVLRNCKKIYLEGYTVDFPYAIPELEKNLGIKMEILGRKEVEDERLINEAKKQDIALLIYGCPLFATTHLTLLMDAKKMKVKTGVIYAASVFDAVAECGLELYKFGKITSMPRWIAGKFEPTSFMDIVKQNELIKAHSLILIDIGLKLEEAFSQLETAAEKNKMKLDKIVVCSQLGTENSRFFYDKPEKLNKKKINAPFCIIIPSSELHFTEKEALEKL